MFKVIPDKFLPQSLTKCFVQLQQTSSWEGAWAAWSHHLHSGEGGTTECKHFVLSLGNERRTVKTDNDPKLVSVTENKEHLPISELAGL